MHASLVLAAALAALPISRPVAARLHDPEVRIRSLGPDGTPLVSADVDIGFLRFSRSSTRWDGASGSTDAKGVLIHGLSEGAVAREGEVRSLDISVDHEGTSIESRILLEGSIDGRVDLGDLILFDPRAANRWSSFDDHALRAEWERWSELGYGREREGILREIGRRRDPEWLPFLESVMAEAKAGDWPDHSQVLCCMRAIQMVQGHGDPLALVRMPQSQPSDPWTFGDLPALGLTLRNRDAEVSLMLTEGGSYRNGRFARLAVEMAAADGSPVPMLPSTSGMGGGMSTTRSLAPGEERVVGCDLSRYVAPPMPGRYTLRVHYHDETDISDVQHPRAYFTVATKSVVVVVEPRKIMVTDEEHARHLASIADLDLDEPVWLTSTPSSEEMTFVGEPKAPQDRLFRAGWRALPAFLEALGNDATERRRADWIMGLCHWITGLHPPGGITGGALDHYRWFPDRPSSKGEGRPSYGEWNGPKRTVPKQMHERYRAQWLTLSKGLEVTGGD